MRPHQLDARHLLCPMPVIRTQNLIKTLNSGDVVEVICTDPGALIDVPSWCRINGHRILATESTENEIRLTIEVDGG